MTSYPVGLLLLQLMRLVSGDWQGCLSSWFGAKLRQSWKPTGMVWFSSYWLISELLPFATSSESLTHVALFHQISSAFWSSEQNHCNQGCFLWKALTQRTTHLQNMTRQLLFTLHLLYFGSSWTSACPAAPNQIYLIEILQTIEWCTNWNRSKSLFIFQDYLHGLALGLQMHEIFKGAIIIQKNIISQFHAIRYYTNIINFSDPWRNLKAAFMSWQTWYKLKIPVYIF